MADQKRGWRKSSYTGTQEGGNCVEINEDSAPHIFVRDSKQPRPHSDVLRFSQHRWSAFVAGVRHGGDAAE